MEEDAGRGGDPSIGRKGYTRTLPLTLFRIMFQYSMCHPKEKRSAGDPSSSVLVAPAVLLAACGAEACMQPGSRAPSGEEARTLQPECQVLPGACHLRNTNVASVKSLVRLT